MSLPNLLLGVLFSTLYGTLFHLLRGGNIIRLFLYILLSWIGFWLGHWVGGEMGWTFLSIGTLRLGMATVGSILIMILGSWLSIATPGENRK